MILKKCLNFKNSTQKFENYDVIFSIDIEGNIWHEYANDNPLNGIYYMILNNKIIGVSSDPTLLSPIQSSDIFCLDNNNFTVGDYVYYNYINNELIQIENPPSGIYTKYNGVEWIIEASLEEQIEHYKNLIIQKTRKLGIENLAGFGNPNLELELNELKKIHLEKSHELALQIENKLREV